MKRKFSVLPVELKNMKNQMQGNMIHWFFTPVKSVLTRNNNFNISTFNGLINFINVVCFCKTGKSRFADFKKTIKQISS